MDFGNIFNMLNKGNSNNNSTEPPQNPFNNQSNNNMLSSILPILMGGNQQDLLANLTKSNPNLSSLLNMMPKGTTTKPNKKKKQVDYVKVKDFYENN